VNVTRKFRNIWSWLVPGWLQSGQGELVLYVQGLLKDAFAERSHQTARLHALSICPSDALDMHGRSRALPRGFSEDEASYRARLIRWRWPRGHRVRGNAQSLLEQISVVFGGAVEAQTIDARGTRFTYGSDTVERGVTWDWDGESLTPNWARFWVVLTVPGAAPWPALEDGGWGPTVGGNPDIALAGSGIHPGQLEAVRRLVRVGRLSWTPAGRRPVYLTLYFDGDPYPTPDGTWDSWANRDPVYRYTPLHESIT
jgi:hypothetical protein